MDYEKKYNEALNWMRELYPGLHGATKEDAEHYFPELRENEDERMIRMIESFLSAYGADYFINDEWHEIEVWLEKQKKRGHLTKEEEYILHRIIEYLEDETCPPEWISLLHDIYCFPYEKQKEQKPVDPSDDELQRHQDELYNFKVFAAKQAKEHHISFVHDFEWNNFCAEILSYFTLEQKPAEWSKQQVVNALTSMLNERITPFHQKSLDGTIGDKEKMFMDALVEMRSFVNSPSFDIGKENSAEWSEEDEKMLTGIIERGSVQVPPYTTALREEQIEWLMNRLKSLRPQPHWKPSEEQMEALILAIEGKCPPTSYMSRRLEDLYDGLANTYGTDAEPGYYQHFDPDC